MSVFRRRLMGAFRKESVIDMPNYMTIEALEDGLTAKLTRTACEYSIDGGEWVSLGADTSTPAINAGHIISFKANNPTANATYGIGTFTIGKKCNLKGNCMSMLAYDDAANMTTVKLNGFRTLFKNCTNIVNVEKGFLPATTLNNYCYYQMFYGCSNLVNTPDLPSTTLANYCYKSMFQSCYSLETPPELPATTLASYCYDSMFSQCINIKEAPLLPAKKMKTGCYRCMFYDCKILKDAPDLPATTLASYCYDRMFYGCSNLVNLSVVAGSYLYTESCYGMFYECTSLKETPSMSIAGMNTNCCRNMFSGCTNLESINMTISTSTFYDYSCYGMFTDCSKLVDASSLFHINSSAVLGTSCFAYMFTRCTNLRIAPLLPSKNLAVGCYSGMFANCGSLVNAPELPATTLAQSCYYGMFESCALAYIYLPALELVEDCYGQMFFACENLSEIKAMFLTTPSTEYTNKWVYGVDQFGRFTKNKDATWDVKGEHGIPRNWTVVTV